MNTEIKHEGTFTLVPCEKQASPPVISFSAESARSSPIIIPRPPCPVCVKRHNFPPEAHEDEGEAEWRLCEYEKSLEMTVRTRAESLAN